MHGATMKIVGKEVDMSFISSRNTVAWWIFNKAAYFATIWNTRM